MKTELCSNVTVKHKQEEEKSKTFWDSIQLWVLHDKLVRELSVDAREMYRG